MDGTGSYYSYVPGSQPTRFRQEEQPTTPIASSSTAPGMNGSHYPPIQARQMPQLQTTSSASSPYLGHHSSPASSSSLRSPQVGTPQKSSNGQNYTQTAITSAQNTPEQASPANGSQGAASGYRATRKKKAMRACAQCQKAHLTCDDSRPCLRCIKRGMGDSCTEGSRKKAKYLLNEAELDAIRYESGSKGKERAHEDDVVPQNFVNTAPQDIAEGLSIDPNYPFGSQTANLEYSMLTAMLGNTPVDGSSHLAAIPPMPPEAMNGPGSQMDPVWQQTQPGIPAPLEPASSFPTPSHPSALSTPIDSRQSFTPSFSPQFAGPDTQSQQIPPTPFDPRFVERLGIDTGHYGQSISPAGTSSHGVLTPNQQIQPLEIPLGPSGSLQAPPIGAYQPAQTTISAMGQMPPQYAPPPPPVLQPQMQPHPLHGPYADQRLAELPSRSIGQWQTAGDAVYVNVTAGFDYKQGYHFLMRHLSEKKFENNDVLRVVRALAIFRPSLIALSMPMSDQDDVFVERALQRSLLELEKLISYSGTPTAIWRRTGEICVVGLEFCMLTGWSKEDLLGSRKYIYELFERQSTVEYWENFASHAFENSSQSVHSHCVLLKPNGDPVACAFCFTIKKDMFDIPNLIIGQWLPLF